MGLFKLTKQDKDYQALQDMLSPKEDQGEETTTTGILSKPDTKKEEDEESTFLSFFGNVFDRSKSQAEEISRMMQEEAERSALEVRLSRQTAGITRSLPTEIANKRYNESALSGPMKLAPRALEEPVPVDVEELETPKESMDNERQSAINRMLDSIFTSDSDTTVVTDDADGGAAPSDGKGLMSPTTEEVTKTVTDLVYDDFVGNKQEGDEAHVGQDNKNITLAGGVVPDGLKYDGKDFTQGAAKVVGFDKTKLDTSGAYKKVGNVTVKRSDFDSDKAFAKGVIEEFKNQAKTAAGNSWDKMSEGSKKAVVKIGWNKGTGWYTGKSAKAIYKELAKEEPNATNLYSKILTGSTVKDGGASIGIAKARANAWNETISATGGKEIVKIDADNSGTNTAFKYYDTDGNLLHTEQTSRASTKYENKGTDSISKNAKGVW